MALHIDQSAAGSGQWSLGGQLGAIAVYGMIEAGGGGRGGGKER